ncbi:MAG: motility protein A [Planctomycetaceae bacterium]|jgi:chemotaxis protein MotA|nr:motility protein A [Planctomycetaceae bacterium]MBT6157389.1 motility protein A [Planctomycetaceae bacterium]MBT6483447.1 motility protein A [Planctomycetaceae bacterium]MBT6493897.1 motility protein A [Planctomycetaceae bacterium]
MDKATISGLAGGIGLLVLAIAIAPGSTFGAFFDPASAAVVVGGAIAACFIAFPLNMLMRLPKIVMKLFSPKEQRVKDIITEMVSISEIARRDGILALESKTEEIEDPFLLLGVQMAIDGTDSEVMDAIMQSEIDAVSSRHKNAKSILDSLGRYAPAFGMIGTLMGLIIMLGNMADPDAIGPGMAVALITTLYGAVVANLFCLPFADKLAYYSKKEIELRELILKGVLSIQEGDNPRVLEQKLNMVLPPAERETDAEAA